MAYYPEIVDLGRRVKRARIEQKWEPAELARRLFISVEKLYAIERGENPEITLREVLALCQKLRVPIAELVSLKSSHASPYRIKG
ncbi:helix-turn-helix domain-containing protein [Candidatus Saccharibacteria bacterium]|nr:helix-turn-helix domain-containing protein [Candidatus Saccharibacteria bacterium]